MARPASAQPAWELPGTAGFPAWVRARGALRPAPEESAGGFKPMPQQRFVKDFMQAGAPYRGLLLYHGLGSGKTCSAIAAAIAAANGERRVYVMLPASLRTSYMREVLLCGPPDLQEDQPWAFARDGPAVQQGMRVSKAHADVVGKQGGLWVPSADGTPFAQMNEGQKQQLRAQLDVQVNAALRLVHYNSSGAIRQLAAQEGVNPFDNSVVVVDEVQNFVSRVMNGGMLARIYELMLDARGCKVMLLSGTPLVNRPEELAYLANLAHGPVLVHEVRLSGSLSDAGARALQTSPYVREFRVDPARPVVQVRLVPEGFVRVDGAATGVVMSPDGKRAGVDAMVSAVRTGLTRAGDRVVGQVRTVRLDLLPTAPDRFAALFVKDAETGELRNTDVLVRRLQGIISYFRGHHPDLYPRVHEVRIVRAPMSARQFAEYSVQRSIERRREDAAARIRAARKSSSQQLSAQGGDDANYRPYSRAICNFAFPEGLPRPHPGDDEGGAVNADAEGDEEPISPTEARKQRQSAYQRALAAAVVTLKAMAGRLALAGGEAGGEAVGEAGEGGEQGLAELSPKYARIVRELQGLAGKGTAIVYSTFRKVEGIALLTAALDANGFSALSLHRAPAERPGALGGGLRLVAPDDTTRPRFIVHSNEDPEAARVLLALFNGLQEEVPSEVLSGARRMLGLPADAPVSNLRGQVATVLLVTQSGAEGINTRAVRQVHVLEPFWHANRITQVIGRAVRAHSHDKLPLTDRDVRVFVYMATFTPDQAKQHRRDGGLTSDEYVHGLAQRKRRVLQGLLNVMREAAVDCGRPETGDQGVKCFAPPVGLPPDAPLMLPDAEQDVAMGPAKRQRASRLRAVRGKDGSMYYQDPSTGLLYEYETLRNEGRVVPV